MLATYGKISKIVHKAYPESIIYNELDELLNILPLDPNISNIDIIALNDGNLVSISSDSKKIMAALQEKHPNLNVIVFCRNESQLRRIIEKVPSIQGVITPRITEDIVKKHISDLAQQCENRLISGAEILTTDMVSAPETEIPNEVSCGNENYNIEIPFYEESAEAPDVNAEETETLLPPPQVDLDDPEPEIQLASEEVQEQHTLEQDYMTLQDIHDNLHMDKILRSMAVNSTDFINLSDRLQILEKHLVAVSKDTSLTTSQQIELMRSITTEKALLKGMSNDILTNTLVSIFNTVFTTVVVKLDKDISACKQKIANLSEIELYHGNQKLLTNLIQDKYELQKELSDDLYTLQQIYSRVSKTVVDAQKELSRGIPSDNMYLNNCYDNVLNIAPSNLKEHVDMLF